MDRKQTEYILGLSRSKEWSLVETDERVSGIIAKMEFRLVGKHKVQSDQKQSVVGSVHG